MMFKYRSVAFALPIVGPLLTSTVANADDIFVIKSITSFQTNITGSFSFREKKPNKIAQIVENEASFIKAREIAKKLPTPISRAVLTQLDAARVTHLEKTGKIVEAIEYRIQSDRKKPKHP